MKKAREPQLRAEPAFVGYAGLVDDMKPEPQWDNLHLTTTDNSLGANVHYLANASGTNATCYNAGTIRGGK